MKTFSEDNLLFSISEEDMQFEALEKIGRTLTGEELEIARKGLEWGLLTDIDSVYNAIFEKMLPKKV